MKKLIVVSLLSLLSTFALAQPLVAVIDTERGVMRAELNEKAAPTTVANFVNLAMRGFYDGLTFHRVERNFMAQGGDPLATGTGGPGYRFAGELLLKHNRQGALSMANSGPGTDGSQFFITHLATPPSRWLAQRIWKSGRRLTGNPTNQTERPHKQYYN